MADGSGPTPRELYTAYKAQERVYETAARNYKQAVCDVLDGMDLALVEARHKRPLELYKKQRRKAYADPWVECPDLVGVRVIVPLSSDKQVAVDEIKSSGAFADVEVEDQSVGADPEKLAYRGLHVHLTSGAENDDGKPIKCELQIRTTAEHSWAMTDHKFVYKNPDSLTYEIRRTFRRLLVLVELYDQELSKGVEMVKSDPAYAQMSLVLGLESRFEQLTGIAGDQETTREFVSLLSGSTGINFQALSQLVDDFLKSDEKSIVDLVKEHGPDSAGFDVDAAWLTSQPELMLVMSLLSHDQYQLSNALADTDAYQYVEPIAIWTDHVGFVRS